MRKKSPINGAFIVKLPLKATKYFRSLGRNTKLAVILFLVLAVVAVWAGLFRKNNVSIADNATEQQEVKTIENAPIIKATLTLAEGVVEQRNELGEWSKAEKDITFNVGMGLRTVGAASRAVLTLEDGSVVRLDANTEITFESLSQASVVIEQKSGNVYNRIIASNSRSYSVKTDNAQFQSVGTSFRTIASGDEEAVEVYQNSVKETTNNKSAQEGEKLIARSNVNPDKNNYLEKLDIEIIKKDLFIIWNREQDLQNPAFKSQLGFLKDFDGPKIDITEPAVGSVVTVPIESPQATVTIKGKTDKGSKLTVQSKSIGASTPVEVAVGDDGSFDSGILTAAMGNSTFELIATDPIGNKTTLNVSYSFKRQSTVQEQSIVLEVSQTSDKLLFEWSLTGISTPNGVKIYWGETSNPATVLQTVTSGNSFETDKLPKFTNNKTYYFRVCRYLSSSDTCDNPSDVVSIKTSND
jgi:hypothetical protein